MIGIQEHNMAWIESLALIRKGSCWLQSSTWLFRDDTDIHCMGVVDGP